MIDKAYENSVTLIGDISSDISCNPMSSGASVARFSVETIESWRNKDTGQMQESKKWHKVVCFGELAKYVGCEACKGSYVYVKGSLQTRRMEKNYYTEVKASEVKIIGNAY